MANDTALMTIPFGSVARAAPAPDSSDLEDIFHKVRAPERVRSSDVIEALFPQAELLESPDPALIVALGQLADQTVLILGQEKPKGRSYQKAKLRNFGMMQPGGYQHVVALLERAAQKGWLVLTLIDTPGADPSEQSAADLQSWWISRCISRFCTVAAPTVSLILGEGGSGGALALQVTDRRLMMENALYSVISPESCGAILFRDNRKLRESLTLLRPDAVNLRELGIIDQIVAEPPAGALRGGEESLTTIKTAIFSALAELRAVPAAELLQRRFQTFRRIGRFDFTDKPVSLVQVGALGKDLHKLSTSRYLDTELLSASDTTGGMELAYFRSQVSHRNLQAAVLCPKDRGGCGAYLDVAKFLENYKACPHCGLGERLTPAEWAHCLLDQGIFQELNSHLTVDQLEETMPITASYADTLRRAQASSGHLEALITAHGTIAGFPVVLALSNFQFVGGSMGTVVGEKFARAVEYALAERLPLVSVSSTGGARMQEGTLSLLQMAKVNMVLSRLQAAKGLYISVLANPTTGGALASYVTQGDVLLAEPGALISFAGPRVTELSGFAVSAAATSADFIHERGGVDELCSRRHLRRAIGRALRLYHQRP